MTHSFRSVLLLPMVIGMSYGAVSYIIDVLILFGSVLLLPIVFGMSYGAVSLPFKTEKGAANLTDKQKRTNEKRAFM